MGPLKFEATNRDPDLQKLLIRLVTCCSVAVFHPNYWRAGRMVQHYTDMHWQWKDFKPKAMG